MARRKSGYDAACHYGGKLIGRCTTADSNAYVVLMENCGGDAARVLREYAYFSPELRGILEKVAAIQADREAPGISPRPPRSPWGEIQHSEILCPGVYLVETAGHGGTMVHQDMTAALSTAARKCGSKFRGYLCYEKDSAESVVFRELLDKKLWKIPDRIKDKEAFEESINRSLQEYYPEYWRSRQRGREQAEKREVPKNKGTDREAM